MYLCKTYVTQKPNVYSYEYIVYKNDEFVNYLLYYFFLNNAVQRNDSPNISFGCFICFILLISITSNSLISLLTFLPSMQDHLVDSILYIHPNLLFLIHFAHLNRLPQNMLIRNNHPILMSF